MAPPSSTEAAKDLIDSRGLCLLSLDGGGVRGLSSLCILKQIMDRLNISKGVAQETHLRPCDVFDLICGTSTGGLIAIMLGRLQMGVDDCINAYCQLAKSVFEKAHGNLSTNGSTRFEAIFDSAELDAATRVMITDRSLPDDTPLNDGTDRSCKVFVCTMDESTKHTVRLRDYRLIDEPSVDATIWEAARATASTAGFFKPVRIGRRTFFDDNLSVNNPAEEMEREAANLWCPGADRTVMPLVKCFLSIGTGHPGIRAMDYDNLGATLLDLARRTEDTERRISDRWGTTSRYFRFNVPQGVQNIGLAEYEKLGDVESATHLYVTHQNEKNIVASCVQNLAKKRGPAPLDLYKQTRISHNISPSPRDEPNDTIGEMTTRIQEHMQFKIPFDLPDDLVFAKGRVDRPDELKQLSDLLLPDAKPRRKVCILHGPHGAGKAQLAIEFARNNCDNFSGVFWLDGSNEKSLKDSIAKYFRKLPQSHRRDMVWVNERGSECNTEAVVTEVYKWLNHKQNFRWILIILGVNTKYSGVNHNNNNKNNLEVHGIKFLLPRNDQGAILITTRLAQLRSLGDSVELRPHIISDTLASLRRSGPLRWSMELIRGLKETSKPKVLEKLLQGAPLALEQAVAYLHETRTEEQAYIDLFAMHEQALCKRITEENMPLPESSDRRIWITSTIAFTTLQQHHPYAANLLIFWSFLSPSDLWPGLFTRASQLDPVRPLLETWLGPRAGTAQAFTDAMRVLHRYKLAHPSAAHKGWWAIPRAVHRWVYHYHRQREQGEPLVLLIIALGYALPRHDTPRLDAGDEAQGQSVEEQTIGNHAQACSSRLESEGGATMEWVTRIPDQRQRDDVADHFLEAFFWLFNL